jgi:hypothetical protein
LLNQRDSFLAYRSNAMSINPKWVMVFAAQPKPNNLDKPDSRFAFANTRYPYWLITDTNKSDQRCAVIPKTPNDK